MTALTVLLLVLTLFLGVIGTKFIWPQQVNRLLTADQSPREPEEIFDLNERDVLDNLHREIMILNDEYRIIYVNQALKRHFDLDFQELTGSHLDDIFPIEESSGELFSKIFKNEDESFGSLTLPLKSQSNQSLTFIVTRLPHGRDIIYSCQVTKSEA